MLVTDDRIIQLYKSNLEVDSNWSNSSSNKSIFGLELDLWDNTLSYKWESGHKPGWAEFADALCQFVNDNADTFKSLKWYKQNPWRVVCATGMSGCEDYFVEERDDMGFVRTHQIFHSSCYGRIDSFRKVHFSYVIELINLFLSKDEIPHLEEGVVQPIQMRDFSQEEGWTCGNGLLKEIAGYTFACDQTRWWEEEEDLPEAVEEEPQE